MAATINRATDTVNVHRYEARVLPARFVDTPAGRFAVLPVRYVADVATEGDPSPRLWRNEETLFYAPAVNHFARAEQDTESALRWLTRSQAGPDVWCSCMARLATVLRHRGHYARALSLLDDFEQRFSHQVKASSWWDAGIERGHRFPDEFHPPVDTRQGVEDLAVEDKHAVDVAATLQGGVQRGVVVDAQVATEPDQSRIKAVFHVRR